MVDSKMIDNVEIVEYEVGVEHRKNGLTHNSNGAAIHITSGEYNGAWAWYLYGKSHRYYGPAYNKGHSAGNWLYHGETIKWLTT